MIQSAIFSALHDQLDWPTPDEIFHPTGAGPAVYARLVRRKLGQPIQRGARVRWVRTGVLTGNPASDDADAPIAVLCDFRTAISDATLREVLKLAWNFCRSPLLVTVEPQLIRVWSCYEKPALDESLPPPEPVEGGTFDHSLVLDHLVGSLHWAQLASGQFLLRHANRFPREQRADKTLLANLQFVRRRLTSDLPEDLAHDLLARLIFIQFLFQRKDSKGKPALNEGVLESLHARGVVSAKYSRLPEILQNTTDTYALFQWLNERFDGDLFPDELEQEKAFLKDTHLPMLADFVNGDLEMEDGQRCLWPAYSFDAIPLEFISSIYEEFVKSDEENGNGVGQHYTPMHLVDFVLDKALPWGGNEYDLKILDPACGSAAFLVKAFQRLVYRWRTAHPGEEPPASFLRSVLERCLFGVDVEPRAIRVASFSLYLAMCDEIDPRHYWTQVHFPKLHGITLRPADFFSEGVQGIRTKEDATKYDLIVGNAPWGADSLTQPGREWARKHDWPTADEQAGTLFLSKAAKLTKETGRICMIQPAGAFLFNRSSTAVDFRRKLFETFKVEEVVNLSALRFILFPEVVGPSCVVTLRPTPPNGEPLAYWCPKQTHSSEDQHRVVIESHDLNWVYPKEAVRDPWVWSALAWGGRRDLELVRRLQNSSMTLEAAVKSGEWRSRSGFKRRRDEASSCPDRVDLPVLEDHRLWDNCPLVADVSRFPLNEDPMFERKRELESFRLPAVVMKTAWTVSERRFRGIVIKPGRDKEHLLFSQSFFGIRAPNEQLLVAFAVAVNSALAVHYFYFTSGRLASYRPTLRKLDLEEMPLPQLADITFSQLAEMSEDEIDSKAFELYKLNDVERTLVEDFFEITLQDFKGDLNSPGRQPACRYDANEPTRTLHGYSKYFIDVLQAGFGRDKPITATVFSLPKGTAHFPFCVVAIHLDWPQREQIVVEAVESRELIKQLNVLNELWIRQRPKSSGIFYQRVVRVYHTIEVTNGRSELFHVPTVSMIKPNQRRYWTRSIAMRDADDVAADILTWRQELEACWESGGAE